MVVAECQPVVIRTRPAGLSRSSVRPASRASMSSNAGRRVSTSRSPASVGATLRVVRVRKPQAQPRLQPPHRVTQGRLRSSELGRSAGEAALLGHGQKGGQIAQFIAAHS
jgi:hypothetical protein